MTDTSSAMPDYLFDAPGGVTAGQSPHRDLTYPMHPVAEAENTGVAIHPDDRRFGTLMVGVQGTGKTSLLVRTYLNDIKDPDAAVIVVDPKSELVQTCLELTPTDTGKRVWYLDLGRPAFGMTPLLITGDQSPPLEYANIAESVVASLLAINEGQIFQSSRRYLYHATIGALAVAQAKLGGLQYPSGPAGMFEDVYALLMPDREDMRDLVYDAASNHVDLNQTRAFFKQELPADLRLAGSAVAQRLDAPRNKVSLLTGVPPLRRFFNHPTNVSLREIIENRDILLVDLNMAAIGEDNAQACLHFIFQMLHRQMQRQIHVPADERPRVALLCDEAHYLATRNVIKQIATHRAAGLDVTLAAQYYAQFGATSQSAAETEEIRKGISNLLNSKFIGRLSDPEDAEAATRIAQAVFSSQLQDDPDARARMRVTPDEGLYRPNYYFLASLIAHGERASACLVRTYPIPKATPEWANEHLARQSGRVEEYPEEMGSTYRDTVATGTDEEDEFDGYGSLADEVSTGAEVSSDEVAEAMASEVDGSSGETAEGEASEVEPAPPRQSPDEDNEDLTPEQRELAAMISVKPDRKSHVYEPEQPAPDNSGRPQWAKSPSRRVAGRPVRTPEDLELAPEPDIRLRELAALEDFSGFGDFEAADRPEDVKLQDQDLETLILLDRVGIVSAGLLHATVAPELSERAYRRALGRLYAGGFVARAQLTFKNKRGTRPRGYTITRSGLKKLQELGLVDERREFNAVKPSNSGLNFMHDMEALAWLASLRQLLGHEVITDNWATPRYRSARVVPPKLGGGRNRRTVTHDDLDIGQDFTMLGADLLGGKEFEEIKPDMRAEVKIPSIGLRFDLLLEFDRSDRAAYNAPKFRAYDTFLTGWYLEHRRYSHLGRPIVLFLCGSMQSVRLLAERADAEMDGRLFRAGAPPDDWYFPGRDHMFFAVRSDLHYESLRVFGLPSMPLALREELSGEKRCQLREVSLLPTGIAKKRKLALGKAGERSEAQEPAGQEE